MIKKLCIVIIKSILWLIDKNHRQKQEIDIDDVKKFTHTESVLFHSDFALGVNAFRTVPYECWELKTNTKTIYGADKHLFYQENGKTIWLKDCIPYETTLHTEHGPERVTSVRNLGFRSHMYDIGVNHPKHYYYANGILSHNTTTAAAYIVWRGIFRPDQTILIAANKNISALEIMQRIRYTYEELPEWLKAGAVTYNKGSIEFDNGSRIISRATTPDAGRGLSISLLYLDEFAFVRPRIAEEFWTAIQPTLSTGGDCIITSTPNSDEDQFAKIWFGAENNIDENGKERQGGIGINGFKAIKVTWEAHPDRDDKWAEEQMQKVGLSQFEREFACLAHNNKLKLRDINGTIIEKTIKELYDELNEEYDYDKIIKNTKYEILTPDDWQFFSGVVKYPNKKILKIILEENMSIECTYDHELYFSKNEKKEAQLFVKGEMIETIIGSKKIINFEYCLDSDVYDILNVDFGNRFYANEILVSNCKFIQADETLIHSLRLSNLSGVEPILVDDNIRWYNTPQPNKTYIVGYDPAVGTGGDYAAIQVFQMPEMEQIAEWKANNIDTRGQIKILQRILRRIQDSMLSLGQQGDCEIYWTLENNTVGEAALQVILDTGEENFPGTFMHEPRRAGMGRRQRKGMTTTNKSKVTAAMKFKSLVETDRIKIFSKALISELKGYVRNGPGFAAKYGYNDDIISATLLCVRMVVLLSNYDPDFDERLKETLDDGEDLQDPMPIII